VSAWWRQRSLRIKLAVWYAGSGATLLVVCLMAALILGAWQPEHRLDVLLVLLVGLPFVACLMALAGYLIAEQILAPVRTMVERARRLSARSLSERLPVANRHDELGQLATVFNDTLDRLESSFSELKRFTADASHELRTPLTAIRAVGEVGLREGDRHGLRDVVGSMLEEAGRMNQLIDRLLLLAQTDNDSLAVHLSAAPVRDVLVEVSDSLSVVAAEKNQRLGTHEVQDVTAVMDPALLRLALINLIQNAIRHSPAGKPIRLSASTSGAHAVIEVADEGVGIPLEHQARIFERFYRVDKSRSRSDGGAGLGLAIVKWAVGRMNGTVDLDSVPGRGSIFRLRLPLPTQSLGSPRRSAEGSVGRAPGGAGDAAHVPIFSFSPVHPGQEADASSVAQRIELTRMGLDALLARLETSSRGLSWNEAFRRLGQFGRNEVAMRRPLSTIALLWHAANTPFNGVLALLGVVSAATRDFQAGIIMAVMVILSTTLRFWQERKSLIQVESLRQLVRNTVTVYRHDNAAVRERMPSALDHEASEVFLEDLVPGDVVLLSAGDMVPADLRLIESRDLFVTQSALSGEAMPVEKFPRQAPAADRAEDEPDRQTLLDEPNLLFTGSSVVSGTGRGVVLATGQRTYFGAMASRLLGQRPRTAFDLGSNRVSWLLIRFMLVMVPIVFFVNGLLKGQWLDAFFFAIAVAVGLTPEMLPMIVNATLARGAMSLSRQKAIVKQLSAIQNLGAMDILCTDKTGTLTQDHVALIKHVDAHGQNSERVLEHAYLNSFFQTGLKNLLDRAVIERAQATGLRELAQSFWKVDEIPFDFNRRRMSVVLRQPGDVHLLYCKGAVEEMLQICAQVEEGDRVSPLTDVMREHLKRLRNELNDDGLRVVAVGYRAIEPGKQTFGVEDETGLIFSGFIAFLDPPKDTAADALRLLREHGVAIKILTGDNAAVARKICREVGLEVGRVALGTEIEHLSEESLAELAERTTLFAKVSPNQKASIVRALKARGHTVGFMGDGVNDATALREADVGISVDSGVDIAKEAADIILLEKSLLVLERGVVEGRRTFGNIIKYIKMTASSNFGNVLSVLVASAFLPFLPMLPIQLLVQNLLYDVSQISIPWDRTDEEFVRQPRPWEAKSIATFMLYVGPISSIFDIAMFAILWFVFGANTLPEQMLFQSGWFVQGLLTQTLIVHVIRTERIPFLQSSAALPVAVLTLIIVLIGLWLPFSPLAATLDLHALPGAYFYWLAGILLAYCVSAQLLKKLYIRRFHSWL
jgi:P-type Mg2+ transporter